MDRKPLIFAQDIPQTIRKTIQELAKVDRDEIVLRKENAEKGRDISDILLNTDEFTARRESRLQKDGYRLRQELMDSELGEAILEGFDYVEDMKTMAAQLMFLYMEERINAESSGETPDDDFIYAAHNLYTYAAIAQIADDDDDEYDDEFDEYDNDEDDE